ncbi:hypothetical protein KM043_005157 [Ampulex compressa]|nr:hypothetical protein KM043_005157 [Ampulex compressa]
MWPVLIAICAIVATNFGSGANLLATQRIVGGAEVPIEKHPHQVSLQNGEHICGASIISSKWLLTAAHCIYSADEKLFIVVGTTYNNLVYGTHYKVKNAIKHPMYGALDYDIALLEVEQEIKFDNRVQPITLADEEPKPGFMVDVTGWGLLSEGGKCSVNLMGVSMPVVDRGVCNRALGGQITPRMICAGAPGKDACQSDSGGPLSAHGILYGIVSWGVGCGNPKYYGVYTNVAYFRSWIKQHTGI